MITAPCERHGSSRRHRGDDPGHRLRRGRRGRRRRRGVDRRRHRPGTGHRDDDVDVHVDANGRRATRHPFSRRRRQGQPRDPGRRDHGQRRLPLSIWARRDAAGSGFVRATRRGRAGRQVHGRARRLDHRRPILQGRRQHRHAHRQPLDQQRARCSRARPSPARARPAGSRSIRSARSQSTPARPTSPPTTPPTATTPSTSTTSPRPQQRAAPGARRRAKSGNGVYSYSGTPGFPDQTCRPATTGSMSSSQPTRPRTPPRPTITDVTPAAADRRPPTTHHRHRHLQRSHRRRPPSPTPHSSSATPARTSAATVTGTYSTRRPTLSPPPPHSPTTTYTATIKGGSRSPTWPATPRQRRHVELHHGGLAACPCQPLGRRRPGRAVTASTHKRSSSASSSRRASPAR